MQETGLSIFNKRSDAKSKIYGHEQKEAGLTPEFEKQLKNNKKAWDYFQSLAPSYRKLSIHWVMSAKQETTQIKRMKILIAECKAGKNQWKNNKYNTKK